MNDRIPLLALAVVLSVVASTAIMLVVQPPAVASTVRELDADLEFRVAELEERLRDVLSGAEVALRPERDVEDDFERQAVLAPVSELAPAGGALGGIRSRLDLVELQLESLRTDPIERAYNYLASESARARRDGIQLLERYARFDPRARQEVRSMLADGDPSVRAAAVRSLAEIGDTDSLEAVRSLLDDPDNGVRRRVADSLHDLLRGMDRDSVEFADGVRDLARHAADSDARVRAEVADSLGDLRSPDGATDALVRLASDPSERVRREALGSLFRSRDPAAAPALRQYYDTAQDDRMRVNAAVALARLGQPAPFQREAVALIQSATSSKDDRQRARAVSLLGRVDARQYRNVLSQALQDPSERVRREARRALNVR